MWMLFRHYSGFMGICSDGSADLWVYILENLGRFMAPIFFLKWHTLVVPSHQLPPRGDTITVRKYTSRIIDSMRKMFSQFIYRGCTNVYNTKNILQESHIITEYIGVENFKNRRLLLRE